MNEDIEHFKRFASCYLTYVNSNYDRIVKDIVDRHKKEIKDERGILIERYNTCLGYFNFECSWGVLDPKQIGKPLKIKLPADYGTSRSLLRYRLVPLIKRVKTWLRLSNIKR